MDKATLISSLTAIGISAGSWTSSPDLMSINLTSDANHYYNFLEQMIYFDTTNEVLKIKHYRFSPISSQFLKIEKTASAEFLVSSGLDGKASIRITNVLDQFRNPEAGDFLYTTLKSDNSFVEAVTITSVSGNGVLTTDSDIDISNKNVCYASGRTLSIIGGQLIQNEETAIVESFSDNDGFLYIKRPITSFTADTYISTQSIDGFSLRRYNTKEALVISR
jgi:hypothetical protein